MTFFLSQVTRLQYQNGLLASKLDSTPQSPESSHIRLDPGPLPPPTPPVSTTTNHTTATPDETTSLLNDKNSLSKRRPSHIHPPNQSHLNSTQRSPIAPRIARTLHARAHREHHLTTVIWGSESSRADHMCTYTERYFLSVREDRGVLKQVHRLQHWTWSHCDSRGCGFGPTSSVESCRLLYVCYCMLIV